MADGMLDDALRGVIRDEMAPLTEQVRLLTEQVSTLPQVIEVGFAAMREDNAEVRQRVSVLSDAEPRAQPAHGRRHGG